MSETIHKTRFLWGAPTDIPTRECWKHRQAPYRDCPHHLSTEAYVMMETYHPSDDEWALLSGGTLRGEDVDWDSREPYAELEQKLLDEARAEKGMSRFTHVEVYSDGELIESYQVIFPE